MSRTGLERAGIVYFLRSGKKGPVKIGFTTNFDQRLMTLWGGSPEPLTLVGAVLGTMATEKALHRRFRGCKVKHKQEWFDLKPLLVDFLAELEASDDHATLLERWEVIEASSRTKAVRTDLKPKRTKRS